jgi:hypothetical protein
MRKAMMLAFLALCACGSSNSNTLNAAFGKTWTGTTTLTVPGQNPSNSAGQLTVTVSGNNATVTNICPDGSGSVTATGSGDSASWSGSLNCTLQANCGTVTLTYKSATLSLSSDSKTLTADASGTAAGCNLSTTFAAHFVGT